MSILIPRNLKRNFVSFLKGYDIHTDRRKSFCFYVVEKSIDFVEKRTLYMLCIFLDYWAYFGCFK